MLVFIDDGLPGPEQQLSADPVELASSGGGQIGVDGGQIGVDDSQAGGNGSQHGGNTVQIGAGGGKGKEKILPRIPFENRSLRMVAEDVLDAIKRGNLPPEVFQFDHQLVRIQRNPDGVQLAALTIDGFRHHLDRFATFVRERCIKRKRISVPCPPPMDFVRDVMAMPSCVGGGISHNRANYAEPIFHQGRHLGHDAGLQRGSQDLV